ncbi:MAG: epoxyqueuosine reductase QueH [Chloroflexi bacterium]|nr:epoxyqueuosine reductase QueH [Chloroflexota bacterium]
MSNQSILIHGCCAHCTAYTAEYWQKQGYEVAIFWYNPNIHPYQEHQNRLEAMQTYTQKANLPLLTADGYEVIEYFRRVAGHEVTRCQYCFDLRLSRTAKTAVQHGFAAFTTSLLISPYQKHELVKSTGERLAQDKGVAFLYADLRKRYSDSRHMTKPLELYRQQYCGCVYSEWERYGNLTIAVE